MRITANHIRFYDAVKLRAAHAALAADPTRLRLAERFKADRSIGMLKYAPSLSPKAPSVHKLIPLPYDVPKDQYLTGNLIGMIRGRVERDGLTFREALEYYAETNPRAAQSGPRDYAKYAQRWLRRLGK